MHSHSFPASCPTGFARSLPPAHLVNRLLGNINSSPRFDHLSNLNLVNRFLLQEVTVTKILESSISPESLDDTDHSLSLTMGTDAWGPMCDPRTPTLNHKRRHINARQATNHALVTPVHVPEHCGSYILRDKYSI